MIDVETFKIKWPLNAQEYNTIDIIVNDKTKIMYTPTSFNTEFGASTVIFNILKVTKDSVIIEHPTTNKKIIINSLKNIKNGNLYFASYKNKTEVIDNTGSLKAFGTGNLYDISIVNINGVNKLYNDPLSFDDTITISRKDLQNNIVSSFSFKNNFIDGIIGYYHELDNNKTIQNNNGFYDTNIAKSKETVGSYIEQFMNIKWFSNILTNSKTDSSLYNTAFNYELDTNRGEPYGSVDGTFDFNVVSLNGIDFSKFTFRNVKFENITFTGCNFTNCSFLNCNFTNCNFESILFNNVYSKDCSFNDYITKLDNTLIGKVLPFNHTFYNGKIIINDFSNNYIDYTTLTFKDFDGSYNDKFSALSQDLQNKSIRNFIDLSSIITIYALL